MKKVLSILIILSLLLIAGCQAEDSNVNNDKIGIRGVIKEISTGKDRTTILVEGKVEEDTMYDKANVTITKDTLIQKIALSRAFEIKDLEKGQTVEVIFEGGVNESYPVQGAAKTVIIMEQE